MSKSEPIASLSPSLLARKGGAKPAMRPQLQPLHEFHQATARDMSEDLGWNDLGEDRREDNPVVHLTAMNDEVVSHPARNASVPARPVVVRQQDQLAGRIEKATVERQSALEQGRRAAFTLRIDAERHLKLRLASTISNQSAQKIVIEALDRFLGEMPELESLAAEVRKNR